MLYTVHVIGREIIACVLKPFKQTPGCYASSASFQLPKYLYNLEPRCFLICFSNTFPLFFVGSFSRLH
jgi:hypothetical protein